MTSTRRTAAERHVRVRLAGLDPDVLARAAALIAGLGDTGPVSAPYANRRGPGFRLYLDLYLTDTDDDPAGPGRRDGGSS